MSAQLTHQVTQDRTPAATASTELGRLRDAWQRIRLTVQEMNYAAGRVVELQAPWTVDER